VILTDKKGVQTLIFAAKKFGVKHVIISPGSRNAPITISFNRSGFFTCHSIPDERSAAFYALGMAIKSGEPVALVCTSGSAAANYLPAITEAFYNRVPLIAITADRPLSWTDQGNGQTIRQEFLYSNHICHEFSLVTEPKNEEEDWQNRRLLSESFNTALRLNPGPVHINVPLFEPLYQTAEVSESLEMRFFDSHTSKVAVSREQIQEAAKMISLSKKVMILVGQNRHDQSLLDVLGKWSQLPNVVTLTETTGNINIPESIDTIDRIVMPLEKVGLVKDYMPEVLITLGGYVISKKLKNLLREYKPLKHWHIHPYDTGLDTFMSLTTEISADPLTFLNLVLEHTHSPIGSTYASDWKGLKNSAADSHSDFLRSCPFSDFKAFELIDRALAEEKITLHLSNSTPIRYVQLFGLRENLTYHCNRGTSGIDGCTSTAAGWAKAAESESVLLITGDMSFVYDSNALWNNRFPENLKIIVINNKGGGIFRIIEGSDSPEEKERFFEAHHDVDLKSLSESFGLEFRSVDSEESLKRTLPEFIRLRGKSVLEIETPRKENDRILTDYFNAIAKHLEVVFSNHEN